MSVSANFTVLLVAAGLAATAGTAALFTARAARRELSALRREVAELGADLAAGRDGTGLPAPRAAAAEIRTAVADALADERERELAEARAFWAEQEAREDADGLPRGLYGSTGGAPLAAFGEHEAPPVLPYLPRQADFAGLEPGVEAGVDAPGGLPLDPDGPEGFEAVAPTPGAIPHPSGPDFVPAPVVASPDQTADRLSDLADGRIPLSDVRPGPLGTLDVYVFADGTTLCMTPGHRETARKLTQALDRGETPVLRGG